MKSKIRAIVGSVLALAIMATAPVYAKGCDCTGQQDSSVDKPVQLPPQTPQPPVKKEGKAIGAELGEEELKQVVGGSLFSGRIEWTYWRQK
jgi:hypothetical protein